MAAVAIVTGGSRNIGAAVAERLGREGYAVVVNYPSGDDSAAAAAEDIAAKIRASGSDAVAVAADVADEAEVAAMIEQTLRLGVPRVLVNNAAVAVARRSPWRDDSAEEWDRILRVNVTGAFVCAKAVVPHMTGGGAIVNISSRTVAMGFTDNLPYVASKAALIGMTRSLAKEVGGIGIRVNALLPGAIATPQQRDVYGDPPPPERLDDQALKVQGMPDDVAGAVAFLASDDARFITGQSLIVDGGGIFG